MLEITGKRGHARPGYEKGPWKLEDRAFVGHAYQPHLQLLYHTHSSNTLMLKLVPLRRRSHCSAKRSQRESAEYRYGKAQAMLTKCQCLEKKLKLYMRAKKGKCPEFRKKEAKAEANVCTYANLLQWHHVYIECMGYVLYRARVKWPSKYLLERRQIYRQSYACKLFSTQNSC